MNCQECRELLDDLLVAKPDEAVHAELVKHLEGCRRCADEHAFANEALASLAFSHTLRASPDLKERIMSGMTEITIADSKAVLTRSPKIKVGRGAVAVGMAALVLVALSILPGPEKNGSQPISAFHLLSQAYAAEETLFTRDKVVHILNEIIVKPLSDATLARTRWFPLVSLEATGKTRFHQLTLSAEIDKGYTVEDRCWYDPATGRFVRLLAVDGKPIYANSFDGEAVHSLESADDDTVRLVKHPVTKDFQPPKSPTEFLGIAAGLPNVLNEKNESFVQDAGKVTLTDGSVGRVVKAGFGQDGPKQQQQQAYCLFTIREDNNTIARIEFTVQEKSLYVVQRRKTEIVQSPEVGWDLAGVEIQSAASGQKPKAGILANMIIPNVSVGHMIEKADFTTYLFAKGPAWAGERQITDILDVASPPHRMFSITYRGEEKRHVVLLQSHSYNKMLGPFTKMGKLIYTSPNGFKVWSGPRDKWLAGILLQSSRATIKDAASKDRIGYLLESPAGTFPALAINGQVTEEELHALIDDLVPAKK